jgi:hypothetical protein
MALAVPGLERRWEENHFNYTDEQIAEKKLALKLMKELWPDVNALHAEWVYDLCKNASEEEINKMKERVETEEPKYLPCNDPRSHLFGKSA